MPVYWADRGTEGSLASKPMRGDKLPLFSRMCARFPGWFSRRFLSRTRLLEVCATTFLANRAGIRPPLAGQLIVSRGTKRAQKIGASRVARCGMGSFLRSFLFFWDFFSKKTQNVGGVRLPFPLARRPRRRPPARGRGHRGCGV